jgi:hypothetical protein
VKFSRVSAALERFELRHEADLPQEGSLCEDFRRRPDPWESEPTTDKPERARPANTAAAVGKKHRAQGKRQMPTMSLSDATLKAVQAHDEGATASEVLNYLSREFGMAVRPNHLGMALQRHRRAGRLDNRDQRWHLPRSA